MYNPDPKDIDKLFNQMSDGDAFPYREDAWLDLERRLDQKDKKRKFLIWSISSGIVVMLIGAAAFIWSYHHPSKNALTEGHTAAIVGFQSDDSIGASANPKIGIFTQSPSLVNQTTLATDKVSWSTNRTTTIEGSKGRYTKQSIFNHQDSNLEILNINGLITEGLIRNQQPSILPTTLNDPKVDALYLRKLTSSLSLVKRDAGDINLEVPTYKEMRVADHTSRAPLAFQLYGGPEWSGVGSFAPSTQGYKFGAQLHYGFNKRLELYTGIALSQKKFDSKGSDYRMQGGWVDDVFPMEMKGKCQVVEIPIGTQYYFKDRTMSGWYANAAMHTYLFASEWYGFNYDPNDIAAMQGTPIDEVNQNNANHHILGSLHIGLGYQYRVGRGVRLQVQPYVQIPLSRMGSGQISVFSYGITSGFRFGR